MLKPPTHAVGEGFHALPALVEGRRGCARKNGARAVPARLDTLGGGREAGAPWETRAQLVTPDGCV